MRKVSMNSHPASIAAAVHARDIVPELKSGPSSNTQVALATELYYGMAHVNGHALESTRARLPDGVSGASHRRNTYLRRGAYTKRRRQCGIVAGECNPL